MNKTAEQARIEALEPRYAFPLEIETAETTDGGRRIKGYANTFGVMRSGRIIHPQAVEDWLAEQGEAGVRIPLLAQHGYVPGFATIGVVDVVKVQRTRGIYFEATLASGTELAEQAWALVSQKLLANLSVGWIGKQARWVRADDKDLDPWLAKKMKERGVQECYAFLAVELLEISLVDIGDDPGGKLAASRTAFVGELKREIESAVASALQAAPLKGPELCQTEDGGLVDACAKAAREAVEGALKAYGDGLENRLIEVLEALGLPEDRSAAFRADLGDEADDVAQTDPVDPPAAAALTPDVSALVERVKRIK